MSPIHNRMPVILEPEFWDEWLDPTIDDAEHLQRLLVPAADGTLQNYAVSTDVNSVKKKGEELIARWGDRPNPEKVFCGDCPFIVETWGK